MKRSITFVLVLSLLISVLAPGVLSGQAKAASFSDVSSTFWARESIEYMALKGVLNGYPNGTFKPNSPVTKAEFIKMMNYTFGLSKTGYGSYTDVRTNEWFYNDIMKAAAQGYLTVSGSKVNPDGNLSREEAAALLARYLDLETTSSYVSFSDSGSISSTYRNEVIAAANAGIFNGYPDGSFKPKNTIDRAEAATVLYRIAGEIFNGNDSNKSATNAVITRSGTVLSNVTLSGKVYITEGVEGGNVTIQNSSIYGEVIVRGGATVTFVNSTVSSVTTDTSSRGTSSIVAQGTTTINKAVAKTTTNYTNSTTGTNTGFASIESNLDYGYSIDLTGSFKNVSVVGSGNKVNATASTSKIENLSFLATATSAAYTGQGAIEKLVVSASGVTVSTMPKQYSVANNLSATIGGQVRTGTGGAGQTGTYPKAYITNNTLEIRVKPTVNGNTYYMVVTSGAVAPTADQIRGSSAYNYVKRGQISGYANSETGTSVTGLNYNTNYDLYLTTDGSDVVKKSIYIGTTPTFTSGYPSFGSKSTGYSTFSMPINLRANANSTAYVIAVPSGSTAPTALQVVEAATTGQSYSSYVTLAAYDKQSLSSGYSGTITLSNLNNNTNYTYYAVLGTDGDVPVLSSLVTVGQASTGYSGFASAPYYTEQNYYAAKISVTPIGNGYVYYRVVSKNSTKSTAYEVMAGAQYVQAYANYAQTINVSVPASYGNNYDVDIVYTPSFGTVSQYDTVRVGSSTGVSGFNYGYPQRTGTTVSVSAPITGTVYYTYINAGAVLPSAETVRNEAISPYNNRVYPYNMANIAQSFVALNAATSQDIVVVFQGSDGVLYSPVRLSGTSTVSPTLSFSVEDGSTDAMKSDSDIYLTYNQAMYLYRSQSSKTPLYSLTGTEKQALISITKGTETVDPSHYTVAVSTDSRKITIALASGKTWEAGATYTVKAEGSIVNVNSLMVGNSSKAIKVAGHPGPVLTLGKTADVQITDAIVITSDKALYIKNGDADPVLLTTANVGAAFKVVTVEADVTVSADSKTVTLTPKSALINSATYTVTVADSIVGSDGVKAALSVNKFTTAAVDTTAPTLTIDPADGEELQANNGKPVLTFSKPVKQHGTTDLNSLTDVALNKLFEISTATSGASVPLYKVVPVTTADKTVVTLELADNQTWSAGAVYKVEISGDIKSATGQAVTPNSVSFKVQHDNITGTMSQDTDVPVSGELFTITFSNALRNPTMGTNITGNVTPGGVYTLQDSSNAVINDVVAVFDGKKATFKTTNSTQLKYGETYKIVMNSTNVTDINGKTFTGTNNEFSFKTATTATVKTLTELKSALVSNPTKIVLDADILNIGESILITNKVDFDGNGKTLSFTSAINGFNAPQVRSGVIVSANDTKIKNLNVVMTSATDWQGAYALQVYDATGVTINGFTGSGADAAMLVNGSGVTLVGDIDVSGNDFGGIEVAVGTVNVNDTSTLNVSGANIANRDEAADKPTIWIDKYTDQASTVTAGNDLHGKEITAKNQYFYYLNQALIV